jgi:hypothetical protein
MALSDKMKRKLGEADYEIIQEKQQKVERIMLDIDGLIYELYGLTDDEIKVIEGDSGKGVE